MSRIGIHWFRKDLRLQDNESLQALAKSVDHVICVYIHSSQNLSPDIDYSLCKHEVKGRHRKRFVRESLDDLNKSLEALGQTLIELDEQHSVVAALVEMVKANNISAISCEWHCGFNERTQWEVLKESLPDLEFIQCNSSNLYDQSGLPFPLDELPDTFTPFRKKVEKRSIRRPICLHVDSLPPPYSIKETSSRAKKENIESQPHYPQLVGGESAAKRQLDYYLWDTDLLSNYKQTRNGLDGWDFSSKLSAWLAHGCISPTTVAEAITEYENQRTKNDSTYWLFFELLWREFFHWQHVKNGVSSFDKAGPKQLEITSHFDQSKYDNWCKGATGYDIVDACMKQLNQTGFMSNRGRQLVASCFVHELNLDWRYGAAYFEYQLIDFDVASNYGNWQYLAGVGADPRGHRQFNLLKQTEIYAPSRQFIQQWLVQ